MVAPSSTMDGSFIDEDDAAPSLALDGLLVTRASLKTSRLDGRGHRASYGAGLKVERGSSNSRHKADSYAGGEDRERHTPHPFFTMSERACEV